MLITKFHNSKINACCHSSWGVDAWIQNWLVSSFLTRMGDLVNTVCGLSGKKCYWKNKIFKVIWEYYTNNDNNKIFMLSHISVISYTKWYAYRSLCTNNHYSTIISQVFLSVVICCDKNSLSEFNNKWSKCKDYNRQNFHLSFTYLPFRRLITK